MPGFIVLQLLLERFDLGVVLAKLGVGLHAVLLQFLDEVFALHVLIHDVVQIDDGDHAAVWLRTMLPPVAQGRLRGRPSVPVRGRLPLPGGLPRPGRLSKRWLPRRPLLSEQILC